MTLFSGTHRSGFTPAMAPLKALFVACFSHLLLRSTLKNICKSQEFCVITQVSPATPAFSTSFYSNCSPLRFCLNPGYSWCLLPQGCVCSWVKKGKGTTGKGGAPVLPLPRLSPSPQRSPTISVGRNMTLQNCPLEVMERTQCFSNDLR